MQMQTIEKGTIDMFNPQAASTLPATVQSNDMLSIIRDVATNPQLDVSKLERLLDMQERIMNKNAESSFNQAMMRLQPLLPVIKQNAEIRHSGKLISTYAKYEDIDREIKPLYTAEGFSVSFDSKRGADGVITYYGILAHSEGHSKTAEMVLGADTSGSKNNIQAIGSTISYAKRYLVGMLFNLVTSGDDDDGKGATDFLDHEKAVEIDLLVKGSGADRKKFLEFMKAENVREILAKDYEKAKSMLNKKKAEGAKR